ncbi:hypothetical protein A1351_09735 [Methylosinus sp. R-45379]|jgi:hypothetical protein|uniref:DUF1674 domain-containing protein n=1 Tax=unclassified Methylosinus TaxID=2624500 RepID=UPI000464C5E5|nr:MULTISPECIES: DUF1674 domain-containing protein [unclassified Methylosinus]OAI30172.1 hypothetical protein A1351_09735 [Methylosinus sp. R-45379]TDX64830.1 uncharacterized protein DUF1674 [Methylosinus sp. sav-2]
MDEAETRSERAATERTLPPEAQRALAEAEERRERQRRDRVSTQRELGGRGGLDPARYGDWESKGIASDF